MIRKTFRAKSFWLVKFCWCIIYYYWEDNLTRLVSKWQSTLFLLLTPAKRLPIHVLLRYTSKLNNLRKWRQQHSLYEFWRPMEYLGYIMVSLLQYVDRYLIRYSTSFLISRIIWIIKEIIMHPSWNVCVEIHFTKIWQYQNRVFVWTRNGLLFSTCSVICFCMNADNKSDLIVELHVLEWQPESKIQMAWTSLLLYISCTVKCAQCEQCKGGIIDR